MLKEALFGTHQDFTSGSIGRAITLLAIPMILEMIMESLFGVVDVFFVSRLGADAISTVGLTESMLTLVFGVAIGLSIATTAFVARRVGEKDVEGAAIGAVQSIAAGIGVSIVVGIAGYYFAPHLLGLMGAGPGVVAVGSHYTRIMLTGSVVIFLLFLINAIFRGAGDAALAMRALWLANAINIVLDPCLINGWLFFPHLGVSGAAVATTIGRGTGVAYQLYLLLGGKSRLTVGWRQLRLDFAVLRRLLRVSITGIVQFLVATASWLALVRIVSHFGSQAVAGYTIAVRLIIFTILPSWGLSNAAATLVGQNLGAGKPERAEASVYRSAWYNCAFLALVSGVFIFMPGPLVAFFTKDPAIATVSVSCLRIISYCYVSYAWGMVLVQAFNGAGDTLTPTLINFFAFWVVQLPVAWYLAFHTKMGVTGAFTAVPIADLALTAMALFMFRQGRWKLQKI